MEEFKTLPSYSRYRITRDGRVFNQDTQTWLSGSVNPAGYVNFRLTDDSGRTMTFGRHSLIASLYLDSPAFPNAIVNHCNGIKGDDRVSNLEWTTYQGNIEHAGALGLTEKCHPISTRHAQTGTVNHYPSAAEAARHHGLTKDAVLWRLGNGEDRVWPEGLQYRLRDDVRPWSETQTSQFGRAMVTLCRNIQTNEVVRFTRQTDLAAFLGVSLASVNLHASSGEQQLIAGYFQIKLEDDARPWRLISNPFSEIRRSRVVVVVEETTGKETVFTSAKECADAMGILPTTLNERLKSNGTKPFKDGYRYRYYQQQGPLA